MPGSLSAPAAVTSDRRAPLAFAAHLGAHVLSDDEVVLLSERERYALNGPVYAALVPVLDGSRSADEIVAELSDAHPAARLHLALMRLQRAGYVVAAAPPPTGPTVAAATPPPLPAGATSAIAGSGCQLEAVVTIGLPESYAERLTELVGNSSEQRDPSARLTVCLVDDYLRPELAVAAAAALEGDGWLLAVRPVGRWLWFGPWLHGPASKPGWRLLGERMRMNRAADVAALEHGAEFPLFAVDRSAPTVALGLSIAARLVGALQAGAPPPQLIDGLLTYDTVEATLAHHAVARIAPPRTDGAPAFGQSMAPIRLRQDPTRFSADGGHRTCPPAETLARLQPLISPITGIISDLQPEPGLGGMHVFAAVHPQSPLATRAEGRALGRKGGAMGKGFLEDQARTSCVGEAIERYSGGFFGDEPRRRARLAEIAEIALAPEELLLFSDAQYATRAPADERAADWVPARFDASQAIDWVPVSSLISGETRWAPAAYCYYGHGTARADGYRGEPYCVADSNGCAAGNTLEEAILQGLLELIERDACGLAWYTRARRPKIDLDRFDGEPFAPVLEAFAARGRALHVLDLRTDTEVPVALAVAFDRDDGLATRFALGCHLDPRIAVSRALSELAQLEIEGSAADAAATGEPFASPSIHDQPHLLPSDRPALALPDRTRASISDELEWCCGVLSGLGHDVLILDQTRPEVGFPTVRVIVPGLRHFWRRLARGRLYDTPVKLGWIDAPLREAELNPLSVLI
jgi:oxazoline/thiazoline synthase